MQTPDDVFCKHTHSQLPSELICGWGSNQGDCQYHKLHISSAQNISSDQRRDLSPHHFHNETPCIVFTCRSFPRSATLLRWLTDRLQNISSTSRNQKLGGLKVTWHNWRCYYLETLVSPHSYMPLRAALELSWPKSWLWSVVEWPSQPLPETNINIAPSLSAAVSKDHFSLLPAHAASRCCHGK